MKFKISKTSLWNDECPIEGAVKEECLRVHCRTCSEEVFNNKFSHREGLWKDKGINHRINDRGYIERDEVAKEWFYEVKSLDDLVKLSEKERCDIIITSYDYSAKGFAKLEIYDDYKE